MDRTEESSGRPDAGPKRRWAPYLALGLIAAVAFGPTLLFGWTSLDDKAFILDREAFLLRDGSVLDVFRQAYTDGRQGEELYYRPLVVLSFMLDARLGQLSPAVFHATNLALHLLAAWMVFALLQRWLASRTLALWLAAAFAVHPAATASVAWIPGRNDSLLTVCLLAAWLLYAAYRQRGGKARLMGHGLFLLLALLTKESGAILPVLLIGEAWLLDRRDGRQLVDRGVVATWALAGLAWQLLRSSLEVEAPPLLLAERLRDVMLNAPSLAHALGKIVLPVELAVVAHAPDTSWIPAIAALALCALAWTRVPADSRRLAAFGALLFLGPLALTLPVSDAHILENRLYLPLVGALVFAGAALRSLRPFRYARSAAAVVVGALVLRTLCYLPSYRDPLAFAEACIAGSPNSALAQVTAGNIFLERGDLERAERAFRASAALSDSEPVVRNNLGVVLLRKGQLEEAEQMLRRELEINPRYQVAFFNLGLVLKAQGRRAEARSAWTRAVELDPEYREALDALAATR
ncbi:MAG: tetratricopeptide repeat protein [Myxococcales bacterium]